MDKSERTINQIRGLFDALRHHVLTLSKWDQPEGIVLFFLQTVARQQSDIHRLRDELAAYVCRYGSLRDGGTHANHD